MRASLADALPTYKGWGFAVEPFAQFLVGDTLRRSIYLAFAAVVIVLLIACANVSNLVLAKGATRQKEMALKASLGASRGRLIGQLLTESLVLCLLGCVRRCWVAYLLLHAAAVQPGDSRSEIRKHFYDDANKYTKIFDANHESATRTRLLQGER